jgi:hypothetical protein
VQYSITTHIYTNGSHFITRYISPSKHIFNYDGRKHDGHAIRICPKTLKGMLTGMSHSLDLPLDYRLHALVYHLDGGADAQGSST